MYNFLPATILVFHKGHTMTRTRSISTLLLTLTLFAFTGCGEGTSTPKSPSEQAFNDANLKITSSTEGIFYGNSAQARQMAKAFSKNMFDREGALFTGGKEDRKITLTDENFLTYCQANEKSVLFLVHVPQFKRYKDKVRDALLALAWMTASEQVAKQYEDETKPKVNDQPQSNDATEKKTPETK